MARTVIGYFHNQDKAFNAINRLIEDKIDPDLINIAYDEDVVEDEFYVDFDNTIELAPLIAFKEAVFGADITEEDAVYYNKLLDGGDALVAVYIPSNEEEGRSWEEREAKKLDNFMGKLGAYDHEIRKVYSNRAGLTTYPQNRYLDPVGPNKPNRDRIYASSSPLNGEVSNVIGVQDDEDFYEEVEKLGGRRIETARELLEHLRRREARRITRKVEPWRGRARRR